MAAYNQIMRAFMPRISELPVNAKALRRIRALADNLLEAGIAGCLEMRLNDEDTADFCVILTREDRLEKPPALPLEWADDPCWQRALSIRRAWMDDTNLLSRVSALCHEFDEGIPSPNLFYTLNKSGAGDTLEILAEAIRLTGVRPSPGLFANYRRCENALPPGARVRHVGLMLPRPTDAVRVVIGDMTPADIPGYLNALNLNMPGVAKTLKRFQEFTDGIQLNIDVSDEIQEKIGLEITVPALAKAAQWPVIMARLHEDGLVSRAKMRALRPWFAMESMQVQNKLFWRSLNHIKIVVRNIGLPEVKAYLMYHPSSPMGYLFHDFREKATGTAATCHG